MSQPEHLLLDTSIVIHWFRGKEVAQRIDATFGLKARADKPLISVVTVGEALGFARQRNWGEKKVESLRDLLRELVVVDINSSEILDRYSEIRALDKSGGWNLSHNDTWIAATASVIKALLLTTDKDFGRVDPSILSSHYVDPSAAKGN
jgi:tRNA(fMet)-specific endonuclease VapC